MDYTLVVCTYNPDERLLQRCLQAIARMDTHGISTEVMIVDNNSDIPVQTLACVQSFTTQHPHTTLVFAARQGWQYARIAAIDAATGQYIVYFDYDNEPASDYLQQLQRLQVQYPEVAAWGPGQVTIEFVDGIAPSLESHARVAFREKHHHKNSFASLPGWQECYPFGAGLCYRNDILKEYLALTRQGYFTLRGRQGKQPTTGEDTQMVLFSIRKGYAAGSAAALQLKRMVAGNQANSAYLKRLAFGTGFCYTSSLLQVFPEQRSILRLQKMPASTFSRHVIKRTITATLQFKAQPQLELAAYLGHQAGIYRAFNKRLPLAVRTVIRYLRLA